jgi:hypothetical protein
MGLLENISGKARFDLYFSGLITFPNVNKVSNSNSQKYRTNHEHISLHHIYSHNFLI